MSHPLSQVVENLAVACRLRLNFTSPSALAVSAKAFAPRIVLAKVPLPRIPAG